MGMKRVLLAGCLGRAAATACSCKASWSWGFCVDQAGCPETRCDAWYTTWCEVEPDGCEGATCDGVHDCYMDCDQSTPVASHAPTASPAPTVAPSTVAPSASPAPTAYAAMTDWGSDTARCFSTLNYDIGFPPTIAECWAMCYATFGLELVAANMDAPGHCHCQNDCMCMDFRGVALHTATLASVSALPGACGDAPGEGDACHCLDCYDAINGGVCYPGMIGKLNPVIQLSNGTVAEVITTVCPDVDPDALCADAAAKAQFLAPAALAAALLLSL